MSEAQERSEAGKVVDEVLLTLDALPEDVQLELLRMLLVLANCVISDGHAVIITHIDDMLRVMGINTTAEESKHVITYLFNMLNRGNILDSDHEGVAH